jgi:hypothetical protein
MADKVRAVLVGGAFRHDAGQLLGWGGWGVHQPKTITTTVHNSCSCKQQHIFLLNSIHALNKQPKLSWKRTVLDLLLLQMETAGRIAIKST